MHSITHYFLFFSQFYEKSKVVHFQNQHSADFESLYKTVQSFLVCENITNQFTHNKNIIISADDTENRIEKY